MAVYVSVASFFGVFKGPGPDLPFSQPWFFFWTGVQHFVNMEPWRNPTAGGLRSWLEFFGGFDVDVSKNRGTPK